MNSANQNRFLLVDQLRGLAVLLMTIFHFSYDLNLHKLISVDMKSPFWFTFPRVIVFLFFFSVGISLRLSHAKGIRWDRFWKRFRKIAFFAVIISVSTFFIFPSRWIYFGTLHSIAISSLVALPFLAIPKISLLAALAILIPSFFGINIPWITLKHLSMDYIPLFPWFAIVLLGVFAESINLHKIRINLSKLDKLLSYCSKHALIIYLIHQPLLYGITYGIYLISKKP